MIAGILAYANSLSGPFILDDQSTIVENQQIREWWRPSRVLVPEANTAIAGRPIANLSFAINYAIGGLDVRGYHVFNIALHLACGLLAFGLIRRTLELPRLRERFASVATNAAFAVALLWIVHPLNSEVVDYLTERTESLMALCYLLTLYATVRRWPVLAVASCAIGMACKESMVTAPVMVVLYERLFVFGSFAQAVKERRGVYAALASSWIVLGALMQSGPRAAVGGFQTGVSSWTYLLNQALVITDYLRLAFWPRGLVVFYGWPATLTIGDVVPQGLLIGALLTATVVSLARAPMLGFLGAWFFATLAPTSSFVPIATEVGAERRMYLPLLAVIALAVAGCVTAWKRSLGRHQSLYVLDRHVGSGQLAAAVALALTAGALTLATVARNREYESFIGLARTVVERRPTGIAHHILGEQLVTAGAHAEAVTHLGEAVTRGDSRAGRQLGIELFNVGQPNEAVPALEAFLRTANLSYRLVPRWLEPSPVEVLEARAVLGRAFATLTRWPEAAEQAQRMLAMAPGSLEGRLLLADALFGQRRYTEAGQQYRAYIQSRPDDVRALTNLGITTISDGRLDEAVAIFQRAVQTAPKDANARRVLGLALLDRGDVVAAAAQFREGVALNPNDSALRDLLAQTTPGRAR